MHTPWSVKDKWYFFGPNGRLEYLGSDGFAVCVCVCVQSFSEWVLHNSEAFISLLCHSEIRKPERDRQIVVFITINTLIKSNLMSSLYQTTQNNMLM